MGHYLWRILNERSKITNKFFLMCKIREKYDEKLWTMIFKKEKHLAFILHQKNDYILQRTRELYMNLATELNFR